MWSDGYWPDGYWNSGYWSETGGGGSGNVYWAGDYWTSSYWAPDYWPDSVVTPVAAFVGSPTFGPAPLSVAFTDQSTGSPTSWLWDFGDGSTSTIENPTHVYAIEGLWTVSLTASNNSGSNQLVKPSYITTTSVTPTRQSGTGGGGGNTLVKKIPWKTVAKPVENARSLAMLMILMEAEEML